MPEFLSEFVDSRGAALRVDAAAGVIRGIKILGLRSRNGRKYLPAALAAAAEMYEGAKVNVNHPKGHPAGPRDYQDRIGVIRHVNVRADAGLFGDLYFNPKHALAEQLIWDAQHAPENVGLSHNVEARTTRRGETLVVEAITRVQSVDLVADPATTRGLFEAHPHAATSAHAATGAGAIAADDGNRPSPATAPGLSDANAGADLWQALCQEQSGEIEQLRRENVELKNGQTRLQRQMVARQLLAEFQLPSPDATDAAARAMSGPQFWQTLLDAADEPAMRRLVEERAALVAQVRQFDRATSSERSPRSRDQWPSTPSAAADQLDAARFAKLIS